MTSCRLAIGIAFLSLFIAQVSAEDRLFILPDAITLTGPEARQSVLAVTGDGSTVTDAIHSNRDWFTGNENIAKVIDGVVVPTGNGTTTISIRANGHVASAAVVVEKFDQPHTWNFRNQVQSVLSKTGCNSGACHGAAAGKNGFKLSLRGYDPEADFYAITRQSRGRRIVSDDPGRSLILTKPTAAIPHKGGLRFTEKSREYRVIAEWIAQGQLPPSENDPKMTRLEILPEASRLKAGVELPVIVRAHFTDGHVEDVTRWAKYNSTNHAVCSVDDQGLVKVTGSGEGAIVAWYLAQNVTATVTVPFTQSVPAEQFASTERANYIDDLVLEKLAALNIPPSPKSDDSEFLRRASLDTIGTLPTVDEVKAFLANSDPGKREALIEQLLARPEFVDYWTYQWSDLLLLNGSRLKPDAIKSYYQWIRERVAQNAPWSEFARGIILAKGSTLENGAANFYALHHDPQDMVETTSMAFLGMSIQCAHCHDHPNEKWTNDDYYGMVSLFARVRSKGFVANDLKVVEGNRTIFLADRGEVLQPRTAKPQPPKPLDAQPISFEGTIDRREYLADWLTAPDNPYFSKAIVNRIWANYFGKGLVEAVDDLRLSNPPSNDKLFRKLSQELARNQFDLKTLMRTIMQSETYQRSHLVLAENETDQRFHSHSQPRRMKAEVMLDALSQATGVPTAFKDQPANTRAIQLIDANIASYFLDTFGRPERVLTCTCERSDEPSMTQVLHLTNGKTIQEKLEAKEGRISSLIESNATNSEIIDTLYLAALSRFPNETEKQRLTTLLDSVPVDERRVAIEDLFWSVLTSKEFLFQH